MNSSLAYAAFVGTALATVALAEQAGAVDQAPATQSAAPQSEAAAPAAAGQFIDKQTVNEWRAPKLIGIAVYGPDDKKVGKIKDILMNHDGKAEALVIGVGGFLGIGSKDVAVPFQSVQWRTEGQVIPSENPAPPSTTGAQQPSPPPPPKKADPAATEASQGYPDKAMIQMTEAQLKSAPDFQYAPSPLAQGAQSGSQSAGTQRPEPQPSKP
jgi:sporulation protein YlmC with PRC-barrel domain